MYHVWCIRTCGSVNAGCGPSYRFNLSQIDWIIAWLSRWIWPKIFWFTLRSSSAVFSALSKRHMRFLPFSLSTSSSARPRVSSIFFTVLRISRSLSNAGFDSRVSLVDFTSSWSSLNSSLFSLSVSTAFQIIPAATNISFAPGTGIRFTILSCRKYVRSYQKRRNLASSQHILYSTWKKSYIRQQGPTDASKIFTTRSLAHM